MPPKVWYRIPYSLDGNLGRAYNEECALIPHDDDWIVLLDGDVMFTSNTFGQQIHDVIRGGRNIDLYTCEATRIGSPSQRLNNEISEERDLTVLHQLVMEREKTEWAKVSFINTTVSGFFLMFQKKLWNQFPFPEDGKLLDVDKKWSSALRKAGKRIGKIKGLVAVHYYRLHSGRRDKSHLGL